MNADSALSPGGDALSRTPPIAALKREQRREAMPLVTAFIDDMREHFGRPKSIRASENGHVIKWSDRDAA